MDKLNKQYFQTREKHRKSVWKYSKFLWIAFLFIGLLIISLRLLLNDRDIDSNDDILARFEDFKTAENDFVYTSNDYNFEILIKKGLYFGKLSSEIPLMIVAKDTSGMIIHIKYDTTDKNYHSLIDQWQKKISKTNTSYHFSDIQEIPSSNCRKEVAEVELTKNNEDFKGKIMICQKNNKIFIIQGISKNSYWEDNMDMINEIISNFKLK